MYASERNEEGKVDYFGFFLWFSHYGSSENDVIFNKLDINWLSLVQKIKHHWFECVEAALRKNSAHKGLESRKRNKATGCRTGQSGGGEGQQRNLWWICTKYDSTNDKYAISGYLTINDLHPRCFYYDFCQASTITEAEIYAAIESLQFVMEELGLNEQEVQFQTHSQVIHKWNSGDIQANWDMCFTRNIFLNNKV